MKLIDHLKNYGELGDLIDRVYAAGFADLEVKVERREECGGLPGHTVYEIGPPSRMVGRYAILDGERERHGEQAFLFSIVKTRVIDALLNLIEDFAAEHAKLAAALQYDPLYLPQAELKKQEDGTWKLEFLSAGRQRQIASINKENEKELEITTRGLESIYDLLKAGGDKEKALDIASETLDRLYGEE